MSTWSEVLAIVTGLVAGCGGYLIVVRREPGRGVGMRAASFRTPRLERVSVRQSALAGLIGLGAGVVTILVSGVIGLGIAAAFIAFMAGSWFRAQQETKRIRRVEAYYPELIEALISQVRSGAGLVSALASAAVPAPSAIAIPAQQMWRSVQISGDASACLDELKAQWASPTGDLLVETIRVAHEAGGNRVVDVLRELADHIRRDRNLRREVEAKQSWVRVAARVGVAAPWVVLILLSFRAETAAAYNSPVGITLVICGLALSVASYRLMIALGRTPTPRRVFCS